MKKHIITAAILAAVFIITIKLIKAKKQVKKTMRTSEEGIKFIVKEEGTRRTAYKDTKGLWTIGVGHLIILPQEEHLLKANLNDKQIEDLLINDLAIAENEVNRIRTPLSQNQFDALVSICFNVGIGNFRKSQLAQAIRDGNKILAADLIVKNGYHKERRIREKELFLS